MATYTQAGRMISIETPLGKDKLLLQGFGGVESVSRPFSYELDLLAEAPVKGSDIIGKRVTVSLEMISGGKRLINGHVSRFGLHGSHRGFLVYRAEIVPWFALLQYNSDCRIFQEKSVPDIIKAVFDKMGFRDYRMNLSGTH